MVADNSNDKAFSKFKQLCSDNPEESKAITALRTLLFTIENTSAKTLNGVTEEIKEAKNQILNNVVGKSKLAISSASEQFIRVVTLNLASIESQEFSKCIEHIRNEGIKYLNKCSNAIEKVANRGAPFIYDGSRVLVQTGSRVILRTLCSVPENLHFSVDVVESEDPEDISYIKDLSNRGNVEFNLIKYPDVAHRMENIDLVMIGAEAVVKNGGILNKVGTLGIAICAEAMNKPLYVLAETFKFSLIYPLNQENIPENFKKGKDGKVRIDYTPPKYLTFVVTDRGLLTPTAVCDELIEMYI